MCGDNYCYPPRGDRIPAHDMATQTIYKSQSFKEKVMTSRFEKVKSYLDERQDTITTTAIIIVLIFLACSVVFFFVQSSKPNIVYQPTKACDVLTAGKAKDLLGSAALATANEAPVVGRETAVSKCGYTDGNPNMDMAIVAAVIVRSSINDLGDAKNKSEFATGAVAQGMQSVNDLGEKAYFNPQKGQLNILKKHDWVVLSYGVGANPEANTLQKSVEIARKLLQ